MGLSDSPRWYKKLSMKATGGLRTRLVTLAVGLICTLLAAVGYQMGLYHRVGLEALTVDFRFRHCNDVADSDLIRLVDIDDGALATIGQWPWPRRYIGDIVGLLDQLGARCILIDLVFSTAPDHHHRGSGPAIDQRGYPRR